MEINDELPSQDTHLKSSELPGIDVVNPITLEKLYQIEGNAYTDSANPLTKLLIGIFRILVPPSLKFMIF